jgi:hypothetical protein
MTRKKHMFIITEILEISLKRKILYRETKQGVGCWCLLTSSQSQVECCRIHTQGSQLPEAVRHLGRTSPAQPWLFVRDRIRGLPSQWTSITCNLLPQWPCLPCIILIYPAMKKLVTQMHNESLVHMLSWQNRGTIIDLEVMFFSQIEIHYKINFRTCKVIKS